MFDLPETKRVRRNELFSPPQSRGTSPPVCPNAALELDLDFITVAPIDASSSEAQKGEESVDEELVFQLFSTATRGERQKVTLKEQTPPPSNEDVWELLAKTQRRPSDYYVLNEEDMAARRKALRVEEVVVEGEEIMKGAAVIWPGCRVPHKVITITMPPAPSTKKSEKRSKPGKKRRIHLRKIQQKIKAAEEARLKSIEGRKKYAGLGKEERDRREKEDRNKRNREKKIKRRIREKAKKEAARAASGVIVEGGGDGGSDGDGDGDGDGDKEVVGVENE